MGVDYIEMRESIVDPQCSSLDYIEMMTYGRESIVEPQGMDRLHHYENMPIQIYRKHLTPKIENFQIKRR